MNFSDRKQIKIDVSETVAFLYPCSGPGREGLGQGPGNWGVRGPPSLGLGDLSSPSGQRSKSQERPLATCLQPRSRPVSACGWAVLAAVQGGLPASPCPWPGGGAHMEAAGRAQSLRPQPEEEDGGEPATRAYLT